MNNKRDCIDLQVNVPTNSILLGAKGSSSYSEITQLAKYVYSLQPQDSHNVKKNNLLKRNVEGKPMINTRLAKKNGA
jgi:hypothetical protein